MAGAEGARLRLLLPRPVPDWHSHRDARAAELDEDLELTRSEPKTSLVRNVSRTDVARERKRSRLRGRLPRSVRGRRDEDVVEVDDVAELIFLRHVFLRKKRARDQPGSRNHADYRDTLVANPERSALSGVAPFFSTGAGV